MTEANPSSPATPAQPAPPLSYAGFRPGNRSARWALVAGLLGFVPFISGIIAISLGRRGMRAARDEAIGGHSMARAGWVLGVISIVFWTCVALASPPLIIEALRDARQRACMSNLRQIAIASFMYANDNKGTLPSNFDALMNGRYLSAGTVWSCPECRGNPAKPPMLTPGGAQTNYIHMPLPSFGSQPAKPWMVTVLAYEPLTNHDGRGAHFVFADGHAEWIDAVKAQAFVAELTAGHNPPRAEMLP